MLNSHHQHRVLQFPLLHMVESEMAPPESTFLRFTCALLPFVPVLIDRISKLERNAGGWPNLLSDKTMLPGLEIGAWCALGYVTQAVGLAQTSAAKGAFICALFMVVTPLCNGLSGPLPLEPSETAISPC